MSNRTWWKSDWIIGLAVSITCAVAYLTGLPIVQRMEQGAYDIGVSASIKPASNRITIIDIDDASIRHIGAWPWPRSVMAGMIGRLAKAGARQIGLDMPLATPRAGDAQLVAAVHQAGNVMLPMRFGFRTAGTSPASLPWLDRFATAGTATGPADSPLVALDLSLPFDALAVAAAGLGHVNVQPGPGGVVRNEPLVIAYHGHDFPSLSLALAARRLGLSAHDIRVQGNAITLGKLRIPTDARMRAWPVFHTSDAAGGYRRFSFSEVAAGKVPPALFKGKTVLIGITAQGIGQELATPVDAHMPRIEFTANMLQSIQKREFFSHPGWARVAELAMLALVALYLIVLLPRLGTAAAGAISILLLLTLLSANFFALTVYAVRLQTMTTSVMLMLGYVLLATKRQLTPAQEEEGAIPAESATSYKMLGLSFQSQGMLNIAFDKFRRCPIDADMLAILYKLALDFERKRQLTEALAVYEHMAKRDANYKDIQARMQRARHDGGTSGSSESGMSTLLITGGTKPSLGRYEIIKELGKGAMGTVYLGRDPKINREVAIKTLALSHEFEPDELDEVRARFFREAETAGRLSHPNIVTIFDADEERDLAYIAMEYLNGTDLSPFTKKERLLPPAAVLKITGKVAEALHYAHQQGVIHRDIKPANIMLLRDKTVKVTDFGIARITASSKTKTGVVLGTPSYMSPEQLSGKHVGARSDLFSMGIMLYEMLAGVRPFRGDSMSTLMFQIANEPHADIRTHKPSLPESISRLLDRLLAKAPEQRPASGAEVVRAIIACLKDLNAGANAT